MVRNVVDKPEYYEQTFPNVQLSYVLGFSGNFHSKSLVFFPTPFLSHISFTTEGSTCVRDVTRRYVARWTETILRRVPDQDWYRQTLSEISKPSPTEQVRSICCLLASLNEGIFV